MTENEEIKWRLRSGNWPGRRKSIIRKSSRKKEALQQRVQGKAEDIAGGGEASLLTKPEEEVPITYKQYRSTTKAKKRKKPSKAKILTKKKQSDNANLTGMSKQLEKQSNQLVKIEKATSTITKVF